MAKSFSSKAPEKQDVIEFELQGETFHFTPVKASTQLIKLMTIRGKGNEADLERAGTMLDYLAAGLDREFYKRWGKDPDAVPAEGSQWQKLLDMLNDPDNDLELDAVTDAIQWLMGEASGRPTT